MNKETIKLTSKGQLTLPKEYRDRLGLNKGCQLTIVLKGNALVLKKFYPVLPLSDQDPIWDMVGLFENSPGAAVSKGKRKTSITAVQGNQGVSAVVVREGHKVMATTAPCHRSASASVVSKSSSASTAVATGNQVNSCSPGEVAACKKF